MRIKSIQFTILLMTISVLTLPLSMTLYKISLFQGLLGHISIGLITMLIAFPLTRRFSRWKDQAREFSHFQAFAFGFIFFGISSLILFLNKILKSVNF